MFFQGAIIKMENQLENPVQYVLPIGKDSIPMNELIS